MQYKGEDMDLRVPQVRSPRESYTSAETDPYGNGRWRVPSGSTTAGTEPLWVDETVLACCNTAFDMALAHGASEVELEHLIHALTRVEAAARVLEARGVREGQLRRDSAALMASDAPTNLAAERNPPRRSADVEDALRRAVEIAGRRASAATVDDLLWVLLHYGRDVPAIQMLRRLTPDWQRSDFGRVREVPAAEIPRYVPPMPEPPRYVPAPVEATRFVAPSLVDHLAQRLMALEDGVRALHGDLASDRKSLIELVRDLQRDVVAHRGDAAALRNDVAQRLETMERALQARNEAAKIPAQLVERFQSLEKSVQGGLAEGARNWAALGQRLQAFETQIATGQAPGEIKDILERLTSIESSVDARVTDIGRGVAAVTDRLVSLERITETSAGEGGRRWTALSDRLGTMETQLATRAQDLQPQMTSLTERLVGLETAVRSGFGETVRQTQSVLDRVGDVEKYVASLPSDQSDGALIVDERIAALEQRLQGLLAGQTDLGNRLMARLNAMPPRPAIEPAQINMLLGQATSPLVERMAGVERTGQQQAAEAKVAIAELTSRITAMETSLTQSVAQQDEVVRSRDREIAEMHDALIRLGENQHTLASAISDWRQENYNRLAGINAQLDKLLPPEIPAPVASDAGALPQIIERGALRDEPAADLPGQLGEPDGRTAPDGAVRPQTGSGFWWWLFGTDNVSRSNRESEIRWERMRQKMQEARERRREKA